MNSCCTTKRTTNSGILLQTQWPYFAKHQYPKSHVFLKFFAFPPVAKILYRVKEYKGTA